ncbi:MAG: type II toxin-antitoxin system Phd/YefM family antitoxin [Thermoleophilia bacterium]|nr:type II toxin-antitoxin system Phd/YefM family antitoxin [Thermoleophilia bacterium]
MRRITATDAARNFASMLDDVERHGAHFVIERRGRVVAAVAPATAGNGRALKDALSAMPADGAWLDELRRLREDLPDQRRAWPG